ncbi:MAG: ArdC-like ssDNA-binding domain-containing protein [Desulfovermiculus sp.]|nr:ArdC-like ssDNA-binding domain-containing protein [Desulfovermiculus sp.]
MKKISIPEYTEMITTKVQDVIQSNRFKEFLLAPDLLHAFRKEVLQEQPYSLNNRLVLALFGAQAVAGYKTWQHLGFQVRRNSRGIPIFSPVIANKKEQEETQEPQLLGFSVRYVFDYSQVDELPLDVNESGRQRVKKFFDKRSQNDFCRELSGGQAALAEQLMAWARISYEVSTETVIGEQKGSTDGKRIMIKQGMQPRQTIKTLLHEMAHCKMGHVQNTELSREAQEIQAETAAFIAASHLGADTSSYTFDYLAAWGHEIMQAKNGVVQFKKVLREAIEQGQQLAAEFQSFAGLQEKASQEAELVAV